MPRTDETFVVTDLEQVKALADDLRQRLLSAFAGEPKTTRQVATLLGEKPTRLYHHVIILEQAGLLELVETRQKRGTTERYYRPVARRFEIRVRREGAGSSEERLVQDAFAEALDAIRAHQGEPEGKPPCAVLGRTHINLSSQAFERLQGRIAEFLEECAGEATPEGSAHGILVSLYRLHEKG